MSLHRVKNPKGTGRKSREAQKITPVEPIRVRWHSLPHGHWAEKDVSFQRRTKSGRPVTVKKKVKILTAFHGTASSVLERIQESKRVGGWWADDAGLCIEYAHRRAELEHSTPIILEAQITEPIWGRYDLHVSPHPNVKYPDDVKAIWWQETKIEDGIRESYWTRHPVEKRSAFVRPEGAWAFDAKVKFQPTQIRPNVLYHPTTSSHLNSIKEGISPADMARQSQMGAYTWGGLTDTARNAAMYASTCSSTDELPVILVLDRRQLKPSGLIPKERSGTKGSKEWDYHEPVPQSAIMGYWVLPARWMKWEFHRRPKT